MAPRRTVSRRAPRLPRPPRTESAEGVARAGDATATEALKASRPTSCSTKPVRSAPSESFDAVWPAARPGGQERVAGRRAEI